MTRRAIILGLFSAAFICCYTYFNDFIMRQTMFIGNNMPIAVYGMLIIVVLGLNPLLRRINKRFVLTRSELAVVLALALVSCCIPGSNFLRVFTGNLVLPHRYAQTQPGWKRERILDLVPKRMLADVSRDDEAVLGGFVRGLGVGDDHIGFRDVPWSAWSRTFIFWLPMVFSLWVALLALAVVIHRHWKEHMHLPYPIVSFTTSLLPDKDGQQSSVFRNMIFWIGFGIILFIHMNNYAYAWFPKYLIEIPRTFPAFGALARIFPTLVQGGGWWLIARITIYFTVVAIAYFIPNEASFSIGIGPYIYCYATGLLTSYGAASTGWFGGTFGIKRDSMFLAGAYFGMFLMILFTARFYLWHTFKCALNPKADGAHTDATAIWSARTFLGAMVVFVASLFCAGLDLPIAIMFAVSCVATYLVMGRIIAETGLFFMQTWFFPAVVIWALFGAHAVGPQLLLIMFIISSILVFDTREALMPFAVNALKLADDCKVKIGSAAKWCAVALAFGLLVGLPMTLFYQYDNGIDMSDWRNRVPQWAFEDAIRVKQRLDAQGQLGTAGAKTGLARFSVASIHGPGVTAMAIGFALVLVFSWCRLRFKRWPFHPMMFLVCTSYAARCFAFSFLLGWLIKSMVMKYGGANNYEKLKPFFFGVIAAEIIGGFIPIVFSLVYYLVTGEIPQSFRIMPG